jgi:hypothetical protein
MQMTESYRQDGSIVGVYWFPADDVARVVLVSDDLGVDDEVITPFSFRQDAAQGLGFPTEVALISTGTWKRARLPDAWHTGYEAAQQVYRREERP